MLRLIAAAFAVLMLLVLPALAGDRASLNMLGFSEDGRYFAYEEAGEFDGAGGNYSHIFVVDLKDGSLVNKTPFSLETSFDENPDGPSLLEVREKVAAEAAPLLKQLRIGIPVEIMSMLGDGIPDADGKTMTVDRPSCCGPADTDNSLEMKLSLKLFPANPSVECRTGGDKFGFSLSVAWGTGTTDVVHKDSDTLPKSRDCAEEYRLFAVVESASFQDTSMPIAIVSYYYYDFEGTSRRFLAIPIGQWQETPDCG